MSGGRGSRQLDTDQVLLILAASVGLSVVIAQRQLLLRAAGDWLQLRHITLQEPAVLQLPYLGGLDAGRLLVLAGTLMIASVAARVVGRLIRARGQR